MEDATLVQAWKHVIKSALSYKSPRSERHKPL